MLPPHDLIQLATCIREWNHTEVKVLDAITHKYDESQTFQALQTFAPDLIVGIAGIETFGDDMACIDRIKERFPSAMVAVFGFYPTAFPMETLQNSKVDLIIRGEPERPLSLYVNALMDNLPVHDIAGIALRCEDGKMLINAPTRMRELDCLPVPDYSLVDIRHYEEHLLGGPCGAILSARGCPFACSYCTTTYGRQVTLRSASSVLSEIQALKDKGAKIIRFLDDTFTYDKKRVIDICKQIIDADLEVNWTCLARIDTLDDEMLRWMKRAGCMRILVGIESYSKKILTYLKKGFEPHTINPQIALIHKTGIETVGWFLVGVPVETEDDINETIEGAVASDLDLIALNTMTPYASTEFFEQVRHHLDFNLLPYHCCFKDDSIAKNALIYQRRFFRRFYLRPKVLWRQLYRFFRYPLISLRLFIAFTR